MKQNKQALSYMIGLALALSASSYITKKAKVARDESDVADRKAKRAAKLNRRAERG